MLRTPPPTRRTSTSGSRETASGAHQTHAPSTPLENRRLTRSQGAASNEELPRRIRRARPAAVNVENEEGRASSAHSDSESENMANDALNPLLEPVDQNGIPPALADQDGIPPAPVGQNGIPLVPVDQNPPPLGPALQNLGQFENNVQVVGIANNAQVQMHHVNDAQNQLPANAAQVPIVPAGLQNQLPLPNLVPQPNMDDWRHLLRALVRNNLHLPEFSGQDHEDPENFIRECEETFNATNTEIYTRARLASRALKDDAAKWFAVYKNLNLTWAKFCELLRNRYASPTTMMKLSAKLYGQPQTEKEGTGLFLEQRHLLARRIFPDVPEQQIVQILIESLRASVKKLLRSSTFDTVGDLIIRAKQIEQDELEERNASRRSAQAPTPATTPTGQTDQVYTTPRNAPSNANARTRNQGSQLPRCHFCPDRHWHRDCPVNPHRLQQGNGDGAPKGATGTASTDTH